MATLDSTRLAIPEMPYAVTPDRHQGWRRFFSGLRALDERERRRMRERIQRVPGLLRLLMKPRNGEKWTVEDRAQLRTELRGLGVLGLYVITFAAPGGTFTLPLLAWWLDRRRERRVRLERIMVGTAHPDRERPTQ